MKRCMAQHKSIIRDGTFEVTAERNKCLVCKNRKPCAQSKLQKYKNNYQSPDNKQLSKRSKFTIRKSPYPFIEKGQLINASGKRQTGFVTNKDEKGKIKILRVVYGRVA